MTRGSMPEPWLFDILSAIERAREEAGARKESQALADILDQAVDEVWRITDASSS